MSSITLLGDTSGSIVIDAPAIAGNGTLTLPVGTGTISAQGVSSNIVSRTAVSATGTSIDFTAIPSWVKRITVMFSGVSTNGSSNVQIQIGTSSGIETSSYLGGAALVVNAGGSSAVNNSSGFVQTGAMGSTVVLHGHFIVNLVGSNNWAGCGNMARSDNTQHNFCGGSKTLGGTLDRVRVTTVNGTDAFDAGTINILYE